MYYGQKIYSDEKIYSESIDVQEKFVELYNDIFFYVYTDSIGLTVHTCNWELYRRETINQNFILVDKGTTNNATIKINLNDYNLQTKDNNFLLKVFEEDKLVSENIFWYYYKPYVEAPTDSAWFAGDVHIPVRKGGGGMGVATVYKEKPFPTIIIKNIKDENNGLENININISKITELNF